MHAGGMVLDGLKCAIPMTKQEAYRPTGGDDVDGSVAVEIRDSSELWYPTGRIVYLRLESAVAVAQQYTHRIIVSIGHYEVKLSIAIDVRDRDRARRIPGRIVGLGLEGAVAIP